jgi:hypothetical protein
MEKTTVTAWVSKNSSALLKGGAAVGAALTAWYAAKSLPRKLFDLIVWVMTIKVLWKAWGWADTILNRIPEWAEYWLAIARTAIETNGGADIGFAIFVCSFLSIAVISFACATLYCFYGAWES